MTYDFQNSVVYLLLIFTPIAVLARIFPCGICYFVIVTAIALIPLAKLIGDATEHLSTHYGSTLGYLINVTFGNAAEIIITIVATNAGLLELVKASITGSILGNIMLIFGLSMIAGDCDIKNNYLIEKMQDCSHH
jgi:Ca2+:H+ antiporter